MAEPALLIVDDEEAVCWSLARAFRGEGYRVHVASTAHQALDLADQHALDAIILDVRLPGLDGLSALPELRRRSKDAPVLVVTAFGDLKTAVGAVDGGAFDYLPKPFDLDQAIGAVTRAVAQRRPVAAAPAPAIDPGEIVGSSLAMQQVFKRIALVAPHETSVLITGESGTGKELVARAVHRHSRRKDKLFLPVHVAALNPNLVESELFGHVKGSFTGASSDRPGLLALADGGTVFLDELADIPLAVQAKLVRVLEYQEVVPVGGHVPQRINLRILAATHQDLPHAVAAGHFRHDLYHRLNVFQVHLPPLRERPDDIVRLAEHFLHKFNPRPPLDQSATLTYLRQQPWLGNVRELRNAIEHAAIVARGRPLLPEHFPPVSGLQPAQLPERMSQLVREWVVQRVTGTEPTELYNDLLQVVEPALIDEVLHRVGGNRVMAARWLGLARATLRKLITRYQGNDPAGDDADT
jgi:two-component system nitrogen regulation response regulator GlnG